MQLVTLNQSNMNIDIESCACGKLQILFIPKKKKREKSQGQTVSL